MSAAGSATASTALMGLNVERPSCPLSLLPQQSTAASLVMTHVCLPPEAIVFAFLPRRSTFSGMPDAPVTPGSTPSWPLSLLPQQLTVWSARIAHECVRPSASASAPSSVPRPASTGVLPSSTTLGPSARTGESPRDASLGSLPGGRDRRVVADAAQRPEREESGGDGKKSHERAWATGGHARILRGLASLNTRIASRSSFVFRPLAREAHSDAARHRASVSRVESTGPSEAG